MDGAITTAVCARLLFKMKSGCVLFSPSPSLRHAAPRNRRRAILFPSVIFNEGSAFIYSQRRGEGCEREEGTQRKRPTRTRSNGRRKISFSFFFFEITGELEGKDWS